MFYSICQNRIQRAGTIKSIGALAAVLLPLCSLGWGAQDLQVVSIEGNVQVQRLETKTPEKLTAGALVKDNDMIECSSQSKCVLRFGRDDTLVGGADSRILFNISEGKGLSPDVNVTLFAGACYVKTVSRAHTSVFSSNAVAETENGAFSAVVDAKTGETRVMCISGSVKVRNVAQQNGFDLGSGQMALVSSGKEPTRLASATSEHIAELGRFFGQSYVKTELASAGIQPVAGNAAASISRSSGGSWSDHSVGREVSYKRLFDLNKIYGAILEDNAKDGPYVPVSRPLTQAADTDGLSLEIGYLAASASKTYSSLQLIPSYKSGDFSAGLRLSLQTTYANNKFGFHNYSTTAGILDMIDHVGWGNTAGRSFILAGPINDLTIGGGLVVDEFSNANPFLAYQPLGLHGKLTTGELTAEAFVADVSEGSVGGAHLFYEPSNLPDLRFGAGYYFDLNKNQPSLDSGDYRFFNPRKPDSNTVNADSVYAQIYEVNLAADVLKGDHFTLSLGADFAQKLGESQTSFAAELPSVTLSWPHFTLKAGVITEAGRMIAGEFNSFYMSNRWKVDSSANGDSVVTPYSALSPNRSASAIHVAFDVNPAPGAALELSVRQDVRVSHPFLLDTLNSSLNTDFSLSFTVNDTLVSALRYATIYLRQQNTGLYPPKSSPFSSWGFSAGLTVLTHPLLWGVALNGDVSYGYLDLGQDNRVDTNIDGLWRFFIGISRGIL